MPLSPLSFEPDYGDPAPIPQGQLPENWLDLFIQALLAAGLTDSNPTLKQEFDKHVGPSSPFNFKNELLLELQQLYRRFTSQNEDKLTLDRQVAIATKIQEGIMHCSPGFYNRVIVINQSFSIPNTLKALLTKIRHNIVNSAAIKAQEGLPDTGEQVHEHNQFFLVASRHFGVQKIQEADPTRGRFSDEVILELIQRALQTHYHSPIHLFTQFKDLLQNILEEHFYYTGRKNQGCNLPDSYKWADYLGLPYDSCLLMNYPYTDHDGQAVLLHTRSSPLGKSPDELKAILNHHNGLIFFENTLFYTHFSAEEVNNYLHVLYEFSEDDDNDAIEIKNLFLDLPIDMNPQLLSLKSIAQLDEIRTKLGMQGIYGTIVDLNWTKIILSFMNILIEEGFLKSPLSAAEQFLYELFQEEPNLIEMSGYPHIVMSGFHHLVKEGFIRKVNDFILFLDLCSHLSSEKQAQCIQFFMLSVSPTQAYTSVLKLIDFVKPDPQLDPLLQGYLKEHCNPQKIEEEIKKIATVEKSKAILELQILAKKHPIFFPFFQEFINHYLGADVLQMQMVTHALIIGQKIQSTLSLLDFLEEPLKITYLKSIYDSSTFLTEPQFKNHFLEPFVNTLLGSTPAIQEALFAHANSLQDNIVMSLLQLKPDAHKLIKQTLNVISNFKSTALRAVFTLQNKNKTDLFQCLYDHAPAGLIPLLGNFHSKLSKEELCEFLLHNCSKGGTVFDFFASLRDPEVQRELIILLCEFPTHLRQKCLRPFSLLPSTATQDEFDIFLHHLSIAFESINQPLEKALFLRDFNQCLPFIGTEFKGEFLNFMINGLAQIDSEFQAIFITEIDSDNDNLLNNVASYKPELLNQLLSTIAICPNLDIAKLFSTQNKYSKNNALHSAYKQNVSNFSVSPMLQRIKTLSYEEQYLILTQTNSENKSALEYAAGSKDFNAKIEITKMLCHFPAPHLQDILVAWLNYLQQFRPIFKNAEAMCILFDCMEANLPGLNQQPLEKTIRDEVSKYRISSPYKPAQYNPCNTFEILHASWQEKTPLAIKNHLFCEAIKTKNQHIINQFLTYAAQEKYLLPTKLNPSVLDLALETETLDVVSFLIKQFPHRFNEKQLATACDLFIKFKLQDMLLFIFNTLKEKTPITVKNQLLIQAITSKNQELIKELLSLGADANYLPTPNTPSLLSMVIKNDLDPVTDMMLEMKLESSTLELILLNLANSATDKHKDFIKKILKNYPSLNLNNSSQPEAGNYLLHEAVLNKLPTELLSLLCKAGADFQLGNKQKKSALDLALESKQFEVAQILFEEHTQLLNETQLHSLTNTLIKEYPIHLILALNSRYPDNINFSLCTALLHKKKELVQELLNFGADVNYVQPSTNYNMLILALNNGQEDAAQNMLEMKLEPQTLQSTVLFLANQKGNSQDSFITKILLAEPNLNLNYSNFKGTENYTLHAAILNNKPIDILTLMCQAGADINQLNKENKSALDLASSSFETIQTLIIHHQKPLNEAELFKVSNYLAPTGNLMLALFKRYPQGTSIAIKNKLLADALSNKNLELVKELLTYGADVNYLVPPNNESMLWLAISNGLDKIVEVLLARNISFISLESTLLYLTNDKADLLSPFILKILHKQPNLNLNIWRYTVTGNYILHNAVINNKSLEIIALLCQCGADMTMPNKLGKSAFDLMVETERFEFLPILLQHMDVGTTENVRTMIYSKEALQSITWRKLEYIMESTHGQNKALFMSLINLKLSSNQLHPKSQELVRMHALGCFDYMITHPTNKKAINLRKIFLNRILFEHFQTEDELNTEIRNYMKGTTIYSQSCIGTSSGGKQSRIAYAYNSGLFGSPIQPFERLPKKERKRITSSVIS